MSTTLAIYLQCCEVHEAQSIIETNLTTALLGERPSQTGITFHERLEQTVMNPASSRSSTMPWQIIYATATWTWRKRIPELELYNEPELEACWDSVFFVQQSVIRRA